MIASRLGFGLVLLLAATAPVVAAKPSADKAREHWSFRPVRRPSVPTVHQRDWPRSPVDAFLMARLEAAGLKPAPPTDKRTLLRRVYLDLIGLPPTPEEQQAFLDDASAERLCTCRRSAAGAAGIRRTLGTALARRGPLCRDQRLRTRRRQAQRLALPRLRHRFLQPRQTLRPVRHASSLRATRLPGSNAETQIATTFLRLGTWDDEPADPAGRSLRSARRRARHHGHGLPRR